jgi:ribA/ribD-fused uncharacterized protein
MENVIYFCKINEPYGCFSNFSHHSIYLEGTIWMTAEHYFQASKFIDDEKRYTIQMADSPMIAARLGRNRSSQLRPDWEEIKEYIMKSDGAKYTALDARDIRK